MDKNHHFSFIQFWLCTSYIYVLIPSFKIVGDNNKIIELQIKILRPKYLFCKWFAYNNNNYRKNLLTIIIV